MSEDRDRTVLWLYEQVLEIERRLIPVGMHVFGVPPQSDGLGDMLRMVASFNRPELRIQSLPELVAAATGGGEERVEEIVRWAIAIFLEAGPEAAAAWLAREAAVPAQESARVFELLSRIRERLRVNPELDSLMRALRGEYIEPGPGGDIIQNPDVLPTGRNTHAVNPYAVPSPAAFRKSEGVVKALLERCLRERGRYPETIGMVLWGMDNIKTQGEGVAQALWLMGVRPRRDALNRVADVEVVPLPELGRPRIDVLMTVSGIFRDLFGSTMELLDKAVRRVAALEEPDAMNFLGKHVREHAGGGAATEDATARVFSNAAGNYGTNVNFMVADSQWEQAGQLGDLFVTRKCFAYGRGREGSEARQLLERALARVEVTYQNIDNTEIGITDVDHYFEYLGGLSRAVENRAGKRPGVYLSDTVSPTAKIRSLEEAVRLETRTKVLNPKWYEGMLRHGFSGVAEIEHHVTNTFGWSATAGAVDGWVYDEIAGTYLLDDAMLGRLRSLNAHATRSLAARLLEAGGRGFWGAGEAVLARLGEICGGLEDQLEGVGGGA